MKVTVPPALSDALMWTVLTASTIGPGTVAMCSKAGADFQGQLIWCVCIAASIAWVLQEGTARLTITTGRTLAESVRHRTQSRRAASGRCIFAMLCVIGNFAYECNNFAGTSAFFLSYPSAARHIRSSPRISLSRVPVSAAVAAVDMLMTPSTLLLNLSAVDCSPSDVNRTVGVSTSEPVGGGGVLAVRQAINLLLLPLTMATLASGGTKGISLLLSAVVGLMIVCFATALGSSGVHVNVLAGLVPLIPEGGSELALAVVGTTAIPINLLLGSSIARSSTVAAMRRGVGLASSLSGFISVLVLLVGTLVPSRPPCVAFKLEDVSHVLEALVGPAGRVMFAMGLFGAGISSALTIPLGTTLALEELFGLRREEAAKPVRGLAGADAAADATADVTTDAITDRPGVLSDLSGRLRWCRWGRHVFLATFLGLSLIPSLLQLPTISIIMTAQIVNGLLLPCVASALLLCLNDARSHMGSARPQPARLNALMFPCVGIALYLASVVLLKRLVTAQASTAMASAVPVAAVGLVLLASCVYVLRRDQPQMLRTVEFATVAAAVSSSPALA